MVATTGARPNGDRIVLDCDCGKHLTALPEHAGKRMKCPACDRPLLVPAMRPPHVAADAQVRGGGGGPTTLIAAGSIIGVFVIGVVVFLIWFFQSERQADVDAANERVSLAMNGASEWIASRSLLGGDAIEQELRDALNDDLATAKSNGNEVLNRLRQRRAELAELARIEQAQQEAAGIFAVAQRRIEDRQIDRALTLLRQYLAHPNATELAHARRLLREAEIAVSDQQAAATLVAMSDEEFEEAQATGLIDDGRVRNPVLRTVREETVRRNLVTAAEQRQAKRIAEQRSRDAERMAALERQRQEEARQEAEEARRLARANPKLTPELEDVANFPDRYIGKYVCFQGIKVGGDIARHKNLGNRFCVSLVSRRGKYFLGWVGDLIVTIPDQMAEAIIGDLDADREFFYCDVYCEIGQIEEPHQRLTHARIYKIEVYNLGGKIGVVYQD